MSDARILFGFHAVLSRLRQHAASVQEILIDRERVDPLCWQWRSRQMLGSCRLTGQGWMAFPGMVVIKA